MNIDQGESKRSPEIPPNIPTPCTAASGKAACPHRQLQEHVPAALVVPVPEATVATAAAAEAMLLGVAASEPALEGVPPWIALVAPVPFCATAIALNVACVLSAVGLMLKTIPFPQ